MSNGRERCDTCVCRPVAAVSGELGRHSAFDEGSDSPSGGPDAPIDEDDVVESPHRRVDLVGRREGVPVVDVVLDVLLQPPPAL